MEDNFFAVASAMTPIASSMKNVLNKSNKPWKIKA